MIRILGINGAYHELAAALLVDGRIVAAVEEERLTGIRHGKQARVDTGAILPRTAIDYCLRAGHISWRDLDAIAFSFVPSMRLRYNVGLDEPVRDGDWGSSAGERRFYSELMKVPRLLSTMAGVDLTDRFLWIPHHEAHAASAFFASPFDRAAVLTIDGIGEATTTWLGQGRGVRLEVLREIRYPHSLGLLWEKFASFLGFAEDAAGTVMAMAAYGDPTRFRGAMARLVRIEPGGFRVDGRRLAFRIPSFDTLESVFGMTRRRAGMHLDERHFDLAASLQEVTNVIGVELARWLSGRTQERNLCLAGGVALNCVMNAAIASSGCFDQIYVQPAAHDAGTAVGAAYLVWSKVLGHPRAAPMAHPYLGPPFDPRAIAREANRRGMPVHAASFDGIADRVAQALAEAKVVAWCDGRLEFGPRALGHRSLLARPDRRAPAERIRRKIKDREWFRPYAFAVHARAAKRYLTLQSLHPALEGMTMAAPLRNPEALRAVSHVDGTTRPQIVYPAKAPRFAALLAAVERAIGVPGVLNTSLNARGRPLAQRATDVFKCASRGGVDLIAAPPYIVDVAG